MDISQITLLQISAFLGGSLGTIIVKSIIDHFTKRSEHRRLLEKLTYEKKLKVAEDAIGFYSHYRYNVVQMKSGLTAIHEIVSLVKENKDFPNIDLNIIQENLLGIGAMLKDMFGQKYQDTLVMNLYFDFSDNKYFETENLIKFNTALGTTKAIDQEIGFWNNLANSEYEKGNNDLGDSYFEKGTGLMENYGNSLKNVIDLLDADAEGSDEVIKAIKSQIKIY